MYFICCCIRRRITIPYTKRRLELLKWASMMELGGPPQDFDFFNMPKKINFSFYNASMECKLLVKDYLERKT